jgi:hypothetical protein
VTCVFLRLRNCKVSFGVSPRKITFFVSFLRIPCCFQGCGGCGFVWKGWHVQWSWPIGKPLEDNLGNNPLFPALRSSSKLLPAGRFSPTAVSGASRNRRAGVFILAGFTLEDTFQGKPSSSIPF